jgi:hypothetical protein
MYSAQSAETCRRANIEKAQIRKIDLGFFKNATKTEPVTEQAGSMDITWTGSFREGRRCRPNKCGATLLSAPPGRADAR